MTVHFLSKSIDKAQRLQGTEQLSMHEISIKEVSRKNAEMLDKCLSAGMDFSSLYLRKSDLENFDIGEFV